MPIHYESDSEHVVLITIDTLRADAVGFDGNPRGTTPNLDRFAAEGRVFTIPPVPGSWMVRVDTRSAVPHSALPRAAGASYELVGRSVAVLVSA